MNAIKEFDIRGKRLAIYQDESAENPLDMTDCNAITIYCKNPRYSYYRNHEERGYLPAIQPAFEKHNYMVIFFRDHGDECDKEHADGAIELDKGKWREWAGSEPTMKILRSYLAELRAYWNGDVYGYQIKETFTRKGEVYVNENSDVDSCWEFYGKAGVLESMVYAVKDTSPELARKLRKWARRAL